MARIGVKVVAQIAPEFSAGFAMPVGQCREREFNMMCAVSTHDAASTTTLAYTSTSRFGVPVHISHAFGLSIFLHQHAAYERVGQ